MSDFFETWSLVRGRFVKDVEGLSSAQLNWRLHPNAMTIGEMVAHTMGVEVWFASQLTGTSLSEEEAKLASASTNGVINDEPFPYEASDLTPEFVNWAFAAGDAAVRPLMLNVTDELRATQIKSALGPIIDGTGALARLAYHPSYHHAQVYLIKSAPGFPA